jgi:hypothetical protein
MTSFFELDRRSSLNIHITDSHILKEKNILNYKLICDFERIEKLETIKNNTLIVKNSNIGYIS